MHPTLATQIAAEHRSRLEAAAARRNLQRVGALTLRTRLGLAMIRAGLRITQPVTAPMALPRGATCGPSAG
ncbi:hypothetical protein K6U06_13665 [Acidiferrimicrobium sp. IK]|uniref:hypothetical protein n=1 Tax=Acidiferrimicrobium sp. IK TaxID=2871700 RepID=UPI0021CB2341|nr:hypothetical protein [Acidiferrimicrobium sp. IK]MCU4185415.1 hypothetical protein [Acidiferrimicrobium sp. IK]